MGKISKKTEETSAESDFNKIVDYLKSGRFPILDEADKENILTTEIIDDISISRTLNKKLPIPKPVSMILGHERADFIYEIAHDEDRIVSRTWSPNFMSKIFSYEETVTICKTSDTTVSVIRETVTETFPASFIIERIKNNEEYFHNQSKRYLGAILDECR